MGSLEEIGSAVKAYIKKQKVLLALLTATGGGLGTWVYNIQDTLNHLKNLPTMYEDVEILKEQQKQMLELTANDHKRAQLDSASYAKLKVFAKDLPGLRYKADVMERRFNRVQDRQEELIEDVDDVKHEVRDVKNDVEDINANSRRFTQAKF